MKATKILKISLLTVAAIVAAIVLIVIAVLTVATNTLMPEKLTPLVEEVCNSNLGKAHVEIGRLELTLWHTFPYATLQADDVTVISEVFDTLSAENRAKLPENADSLLSISRFRVGVNILKALMLKIDIRDIMVTGMKANIVEYSPELANYLFMPESTGSEESDNSLDSPLLRGFELNSIEITDGRSLNYFSLPSQLDCEIDINAVQLSQQTNGQLQIVADTYAQVAANGEQWLEKFPISVNAYLKWSADNPLRVDILPSTAKLGALALEYSSGLSLAKSLTVDSLNVGIPEFCLVDQIQYFPQKLRTSLQGIESDLGCSVKMKLTAPYCIEKDSLPSLNLTFNIPGGYLQGPKRRRIDKLAIDGEIIMKGKNPDSSRIIIYDAILNGIGVQLTASADIDNPLADPLVKSYIRGYANIGNLTSMIGLKTGYDIEGTLKADTRLNMLMSDVQAQRYNRLNMSGKMDLNSFSLRSDSLSLYINDANLNFDSHANMTIDNGKRIQLLAGSFDIDSLRLDYLDENFTLLQSNLNAAASPHMTTIDGEHPFMPFGVRVDGKMIRYHMADSSIAACAGASAMIKVQVPKYKATAPCIDMNIMAERAGYFSKSVHGAAYDSEITLNLHPKKQRDKQAGTKRGNRLNKKDPLQAKANNEMNEMILVEVDSSTRNMLNKWQLHGKIATDKAMLFTPYFPLRNSLSNLDVEFTLDSIKINSSRFRSGNSDMAITGGLYNIRSTLLKRRLKKKPLTIDLQFDADTLDANELISAAYSAISYSEKQDTLLQQTLASDITSFDSNDLQTQIEETADTAIVAPVIPANLEADIDIHATTGIYADMKLSDLVGCMKIHDGVIRIHDLSTNSDAGNLIFNAFYAARNKKNIRTAFDLEMNDIRIDRFIRIIPGVDSIMPLLKEMEGIVDAKIAASTRVDSAMNVLFPSLTAAVKLHGDSLVLLDSETFASISKMLMFKNKKRNMIDNMDVELIVDDNKLELFPFTFTMDRYKVGVMGHNDLDMNLDYHISVLKSPIPFKFGLNISGTPDRMKYRIGKAKYKEGVAAKTRHIVDSARVNLKREIENAFRRGSQAALKSQMKLDRSKIRELTRTDIVGDTLSASDSLLLINQGLIEAPQPSVEPTNKRKKK